MSLTFAVAASANFPALLLAHTWRRFNTTGALAGVAVGLISSITLSILSPPVWPGPGSQGSPFPIVNPAIVSVPLAFLACYLGTVLGRPETADRYAEPSRGDGRARSLRFEVRAETGLGAERAGTSA